MKNSALLFWLVVLISLPTAYAGYLVWRDHSPAAVDTPAATTTSGADNPGEIDGLTNIAAGGPTIPPFKLTAQSGKEFDSSSMMGHVWVASYFFTSCPGPCYKLNQALAALQAEPAFADVKFVSITCDPVNDTPEALRHYAERFSADPNRWIFLTGEEKAVRKVGMEELMMPVAEKTHSDLAVVLDRKSALRGFFHLSDETDVRRMIKRLRQVLAEKS